MQLKIDFEITIKQLINYTIEQSEDHSDWSDIRYERVLRRHPNVIVAIDASHFQAADCSRFAPPQQETHCLRSSHVTSQRRTKLTAVAGTTQRSPLAATLRWPGACGRAVPGLRARTRSAQAPARNPCKSRGSNVDQSVR